MTPEQFLVHPKAQAVGVYGEEIAMRYFTQSGYQVSRPTATHQGDLLAVDTVSGQAFRVEVKTARKAKGRDMWRFKLTDGKKTNCHFADYVLLLVVMPHTGRCIPYLIPSDAIFTKTIALYHPNRYAGKWAGYKANPKGLTLI